uniref:Uncharacterized protein n=1 Tax=Setaria viridis TaxID=4556 RepID=A0A4U6W001_SETVI|nr:hypothetical protein SEVIR_2G325366v2 [Setaria viridis]
MVQQGPQAQADPALERQWREPRRRPGLAEARHLRRREPGHPGSGQQVRRHLVHPRQHHDQQHRRRAPQRRQPRPPELLELFRDLLAELRLPDGHPLRRRQDRLEQGHRPEPPPCFEEEFG